MTQQILDIDQKLLLKNKNIGSEQEKWSLFEQLIKLLFYRALQQRHFFLAINKYLKTTVTDESEIERMRYVFLTSYLLWPGNNDRSFPEVRWRDLQSVGHWYQSLQFTSHLLYWQSTVASFNHEHNLFITLTVVLVVWTLAMVMADHKKLIWIISCNWHVRHYGRDWQTKLRGARSDKTQMGWFGRELLYYLFCHLGRRTCRTKFREIKTG